MFYLFPAMHPYGAMGSEKLGRSFVFHIDCANLDAKLEPKWRRRGNSRQAKLATLCKPRTCVRGDIDSHYLRCIDVLPFPGNAPSWSDGVRKIRPEFCLPYRLCNFSCACNFAFFPHGRDESVYQVQCLSSSMSSLTSDKACNLGGVILSNR